MSNYFYAYHGPGKDDGFNYQTGFGVSQKYKQSQTNIGDLVFIIQKRPDNKHHELCGLFKITGHYFEGGSARPYRMSLADHSLLPKYIEIEEDKISDELPQIDGHVRWSNLKRHFCRQGVSFQSPLDSNVVSVLNKLISIEVPLIGEVDEDFENKVKRSIESSKKDRGERLKKAPAKAEKIIVRTTTYKRNPDVVAEVLIRANGKCEICNVNAPFMKRKDGTPYIEVHHKVHLSDDGDDTVENAIALCPNCHREQHFG